MIFSAQPIFPDSFEQPCFKLQPMVESVHGKFFKGQPTGRGHIKYTDTTNLDGNFIDGRLNGKVKLFDGMYLQIFRMFFTS